MYEIDKTEERYSRRVFSKKAMLATGALALGVRCGTPFQVKAEGESVSGGMCDIDDIPSDSKVLELESIEPDDTIVADPHEVASRYDLSLAPKESIDEIMGQIDAATSGDEVVSRISAFTEAQFGFLFSTPYAMDVSLIQDRAKEFVSNLTLLPKEFFEVIRLSSINVVLSEDLDSFDGRFTYSTRVMDVALEYLDSPHVLYHELVGHGANSISCNGMDDAAMLAVNDGAPPYTYNSDIAISLPLAVEVYPSKYGMVSPSEDEAENVSLWMTNKIDLHESKRGTPLYEKTALVLDRINRLIPNFVEYAEEAVQPRFTDSDE